MTSTNRSAAFWITVGAGIALALGTVGPWVRVWFVDVSGLEVDGGILVLCCGLALAGAPFIYQADRNAWPCVLGLVAAVIAVLYLLAFSVSVFGDSSSEEAFGVKASDLIRPGWGYFMGWLGAGAGVFSSAFLLAEQRRLRRSVQAQPAYFVPAAYQAPPSYDPNWPAGWYRHPEGDWRWWDGYRWTEVRPEAPVLRAGRVG